MHVCQHFGIFMRSQVRYAREEQSEPRVDPNVGHAWGILMQGSTPVPSGDRRDLILEFNPPELPSPIALANFGLGEWYEATTTVTLKGGGNPAGGKGGKDSQGAPGLCGNTVVKLTARCYLRGMTEMV